MSRQLLLLPPLLLALGCQAYEVRLPPPPTEEQIVQMSKEGKPADDIVHEISKSMGVYVLRTKDVIRLHQAGVDEKVIDYMLETEKWAIRERAARYYYHGYTPYPYAWYPYGYWGPCW